MKPLAIVLLLAFSWADLRRETNSAAANARGVKQFEAQQYAEAEQSFAQSNAIRPSPAAAFNLGTSQVAAGKREAGAQTLTEATRDSRLRALALYNRGNAALASKAVDYAIRDYSESLRLNPKDARVKRNLEIAMLRKQAMQNASGGNSQQQQQRGNQPGQPQDASPGEGDQPSPQKRDETDPDSLLRAVQQQEQEELSRMRRARPGRGKVGW